MIKLWTLMTIIGFVLIVISLFADSIGVGVHPGFGWRQGSGVLLGLILVLASPYMKRRRGRSEPESREATEA